MRRRARLQLAIDPSGHLSLRRLRSNRGDADPENLEHIQAYIALRGIRGRVHAPAFQRYLRRKNTLRKGSPSAPENGTQSGLLIGLDMMKKLMNQTSPSQRFFEDAPRRRCNSRASWPASPNAADGKSQQSAASAIDVIAGYRGQRCSADRPSQRRNTSPS